MLPHRVTLIVCLVHIYHFALYYWYKSCLRLTPSPPLADHERSRSLQHQQHCFGWVPRAVHWLCRASVGWHTETGHLQVRSRALNTVTYLSDVAVTMIYVILMHKKWLEWGVIIDTVTILCMIRFWIEAKIRWSEKKYTS